jgi:hypothetical protein
LPEKAHHLNTSSSKFRIKKDKAMTTSPSPRRFLSAPTYKAKKNARKPAEFESVAQLLEEFIPKFKNEQDRRFYREVADAYRTAARDLFRRVWSDDKGQDIAEYAVMLAEILVLVV